jgi:hypothetical protein
MKPPSEKIEKIFFLLNIFGVLFFLWQGIVHAHLMSSIVDEGSYVYKGYLFASGRYVPFEQGGPYTNHMPLSFLIPGYIQSLFGPGIRLARYVSVGFGAIGLIGLWLIAVRFGFQRWATLAIWAIALNPYLYQIYGLATSQSLVFMFIVWSLYFLIGENKKDWELILGLILAVLAFFTRINVVPFYFLALVYLFYAYGFKRGLLVTGVSIVFLMGLFFAFSPDIFKFWPIARLIQLFSFLNPFNRSNLTSPISQAPNRNSIAIRRSRLSLANDQILFGLFDGLQAHYFALFGLLFGASLIVFLFSKKQRHKLAEGFFLVTSFLALLVLNSWGTLFSDFAFSFKNYLSFYFEFGVVLCIWGLSLQRELLSNRNIDRFLQVVIITLFAGIGYVFSNIIGPIIAAMPVPWVRAGKMIFVEVWALFSNKFSLTYEDLLPVFSVIFSAIVSLLLILVGKVAKDKFGSLKSVSFSSVISEMSVGFLLIILPFLLSGYSSNPDICEGDVIGSYEQVGGELSAIVTKDSKVFLYTGPSYMLLLEFPPVEIFPQLINTNFTFVDDGTAEDLSRTSNWNIALAEQWLQETDYLIVSDTSLNYAHVKNLFHSAIESDSFSLILTTSYLSDCRVSGPLYLYQRTSIK